MRLPINWGYIVVFLLIGGVSVWIASGMVGRKHMPLPNVAERAQERIYHQVQVSQPMFDDIVRVLEISARTAAERSVVIRSEVSGKIVELDIPRGSTVAAGELLARIDEADLRARLQQARAEVSQQEIEYAAAQKLHSQGLVAESESVKALAALELARANFITAELQLAKTRIYSPIAGIYENRAVEIGSFVNIGSEIGTIHDYQPVLVIGDLNENDINHVKVGDQARVRLINGQEYSGSVHFVASNADSSTRTYVVEVQVDNPLQAIPSGMTATIFFDLPSQRAHRVSPAMLILNADGELGVKTIESQRVVFRPVEMVLVQTNEMWVNGIPENSYVISIGHGFVREGERVEALLSDGRRIEEISS